VADLRILCPDKSFTTTVLHCHPTRWAAIVCPCAHPSSRVFEIVKLDKCCPVRNTLRSLRRGAATGTPG
jgi:ferredoxin-thioredoxin reductase catalytic subunit